MYPTDDIIIGRDFNMVMDEALDRFPPKMNMSNPNLNLLNFCLNNNVVDAWRAANPNRIQFSWFKANGTSKSIIYYWLTSTYLTDFIKDTSLPASLPLTKHRCISISFYT